jgi:hypothetical protein
MWRICGVYAAYVWCKCGDLKTHTCQ